MNIINDNCYEFLHGIRLKKFLNLRYLKNQFKKILLNIVLFSMKNE